MDKKYWIGIDLGGTNIRVGLLNNEGVILKEKRELTEAENGPEYIIEKLKSMISTVKGNYNIEAIGIGMPGSLDPYKGIVLNAVNLHGWKNIHLSKTLEQYFDTPCFIENDCNVGALAEALDGAGKGFPIVFYIAIGTGVGGGLCINEEIISGSTGHAGEIANIIVKESKFKHGYLNYGSLESFVSGTSILRMTKDKGLNIQYANEIFSLADNGNTIASEIAEIVVDSLARGMSAIAHVVNPHIFVIGGGVTVSTPNFIERVNNKFNQYIYPVMKNKIHIELSQIQDPGIIGAMYMAKKRMQKIFF